MNTRPNRSYPVIAVDAWARKHMPGEAVPAAMLTGRDSVFVEQLRRGNKLEIRELRTGLEFATTSHVGYVPFENFAVRIEPAIAHVDMVRMMQYAYDIDDLTAFDRIGMVGAMDMAPEQLVAAALAVHVRKLVRRGLFHAYVEEEAELATVRGNIRFAELATRSRTGVTLPCRYEHRTPDVVLNQIVSGGLALARRVVANSALVRELVHLQMFMGEYVQPIRVTEEAFRTAERGMTRLNAHYRPALDLCYLLYRHATLDGNNEDVRHFPGFLLDMNHLFERFIGRLLDDIVPEPYRVQKQSRLAFYTAPLGHTAPHLRPDFRIVDADGRVVTIIDAKYKLLDTRAIDVSDLYQLTIYAMADEPLHGTAIALYPGSTKRGVGGEADGVDDPTGADGDRDRKRRDRAHRRERVYQFEGPGERRMRVVFRRVDIAEVLDQLRSGADKVEPGNELLTQLKQAITSRLSLAEALAVNT